MSNLTVTTSGSAERSVADDPAAAVVDSTDRVHLTAGIDAGSGAVKVAIMRSRAGAAGELLASSAWRIRRRHIHEVAADAFTNACAAAGVSLADFDYIASTGDGDAVRFRTGHFYGMTTHARGAVFLEPETRAVLDIGALHARAILIDYRGKVLGHRMTSQCASGSGQFVENIARYLGVSLEDVGDLAMASTDPEKVSSICAVLAETDVINMVSRGIATSDILDGIHRSIAGRLARLLRAVNADGVVLVTGGMAQNKGMIRAIEESVEVSLKRRKKVAALDIRLHDNSQMAGTIGAALLGAWRTQQLERMGRHELVGTAA